MKPVFVVMSSTGAQGGSVCNSLLNDGTYTVRALTSRAGSDRAKALAARGAEVVEINTKDPQSLQAALGEFHAMFLNTNSAEPGNAGNAEAEAAQGILYVDCAVKQGAQIFLSTAPEFYRGIPMFEAKKAITDYLLKQPVRSFLLWVTFYHTNMLLHPPRIAADGKTVEFAYPIYQPTTKFPVLSTEDDVGPVVMGLLQSKNSDEFVNKPIVIGAEDLTLPQMAEIYSKVTGQPTRYIRLEEGDYDYLSPEWSEMAREMLEHDYVSKETYYSLDNRLPGHHLDPARQLAGPLTTWESWLHTSGFNVFDPVWRNKFMSAPWNGY
ncbi:hypothetical protein BCR39DRAFT_589863 [Naematelia encephala]|uniref:NmrA-like domain-containing protein n=1 Tax=Naematelia encephala TaxID=71784 RepID=A0A1Y2AU09_9TREE|nr:hypothetical protein BCR39DRAFT_589863 [Naematelia encephala]